MEHTFFYDLLEGLVLIILMVEVYMLKRRVKRLETRSKTERSEGDFGSGTRRLLLDNNFTIP